MSNDGDSSESEVDEAVETLSDGGQSASTVADRRDLLPVLILKVIHPAYSSSSDSASASSSSRDSS